MRQWTITEKNLAGHEWIGLEASVESATDANKQKLAGKIVNETKNTLQLQTKNGEKIVPKKEVKLKVRLESGWTELNTKNWCFSPENRVKAFFKNKKR